MAAGRLAAWGLEGFTVENLTDFLARPELTSAWSKATYHGHLKSFCTFLVAGEYLDENPMDAVRPPRRPNDAPNALEDYDVDRILERAEGEVRDWIILALCEGLRASEVAKIRGEEVTPRHVRVTGKGGKTTNLPCQPDVWEIAQRYPRSGFWFPGDEDGHMKHKQVSIKVGRLFSSLGIEGSIHRCRHTYATRLLRSGVHIRTVQKMMRHASLKTTAAYTAVDEDELQAAAYTLPRIATA